MRFNRFSKTPFVLGMGLLILSFGCQSAPEPMPKPKALWDPVGQAGACDDPKDGSSRFGFDDPMLRMQTPFFTFPVRCGFLWVHDFVLVHAVYESASHYVRCAMAGSL